MNFDEWYRTQKHQLSNEQVCRVIWNAATKEERESCAVICDSRHHTWRFGDGDESVSGPKECAELIRGRT